MNNIGWCDYTHNLITGCLNHIDGICKGGDFPCYAYKLAWTRLKERYLANTNVSDPHYGWLGSELAKAENYHADPFYPRFWPDRLNKKFPKGSKVFLNDMSDWMGIGVPTEWIQKCIEYIESRPDVIFQTLTKQPQNLAKWNFPDNCRVGVTATDVGMLMDAVNTFYNHRIAKTQFVSIEPLLSWTTERFVYPVNTSISKKDIDWLIIGAQTKPTVYPKIEWVREIVEAADKANIPVWLKDNLYHHLAESQNTDLFFNKPQKGWWKLRQEFPE